jgi:putative PIN family toxin of toxin-antitoxin system
MGTKKIKVVLDTNVLLSALLLKGTVSRIVSLWKQGRIKPVFTRETFEEFQKALAYPKFSLRDEEIKTILLEEVLPFFEVVEIKTIVKGVCQDPDDDKFLACAVSAAADYLVSGDKGLLKVGHYQSIKILDVSSFLRKEQGLRVMG